MRRPLILWLLLLTLAAPARAQTLPQIRGLDAAPLVAAIRQAAQAQGAHPERQHFHFVFAFSTSHFGGDPGHGEAMRQAAAQVARDFLIPGDRYSAAAWEMEVWEWQGPFDVLTGDPESRARVVARSFPRAPRAGTTGGHDTERAILDLIHRVEPAGPEEALGTVILLFTNNEASMNAADRRVIGGNDPAYQSALRRWVRRPATRLSFEAERGGGTGNWVSRRMDVVVVVPRQMEGVAIQSGTRRQLTRTGGAAETTGAEPRRQGRVPWPALLLSILALVAAAFVIRRLISGVAVTGGASGMKTLEVGDRRFVLEEASDGETWRLVGPRFAHPGPRDVVVGEAAAGVPPVVLAQISYRKRQLALEALGDQTTIVRDGTAEGTRFPLPPGRHDFLIRGQHMADPALPPQHFQVRVPIVVE